MKFILNSTLDTLPTKTNLLKWGKSPTNKCPFCGFQQTTLHILNGCKVFLHQGRFTWRHDNILHYIDQCLDKNQFEVYVDIEEMKFQNVGTVPPKITVTPDRPDIVIVNNKSKESTIFELTVPFEPNIDERHAFKQNKYAYIETD